MSNALAIATVTAAFAQVVRTAAQSVVTASEVLTEQPTSTALTGPRVRLFLYQVTPNAALRNQDLPTRSSSGELTKRPTAAIDLHYLLAFYGSEREMEPQRMLGAVVRDLHTRPVLTRDVIKNAIASEVFLSDSNLAEAPEQVRFTPSPLSLEELSKLWSVFFQAPYALSVAYQGSVLLIESDDNVQTALPVLRRGSEDRGVDAVLGQFPALESIHIGFPGDPARQPRLPSKPRAQLGDVLTLKGRNLGGDSISVRLVHTRLAITQSLDVPPEARLSGEPRITLPNDAQAQSDWAVGLYTVVVAVTSGGRERVSNQLALALAPTIATIDPSGEITLGPDRRVDFTITCHPQIRPEQNAALLLADREAPAQTRTADTDTLRFTLANAPSVTEAPLRLRVDGVDSLPFILQDQASPLLARLVFDEAKKVTIL